MSTKSKVSGGRPEHAMPKAGGVLSMWIVLLKGRTKPECTRSRAKSDGSRYDIP